MANTFDAALIASKAAKRAITILTSKLAPFRAFSSDFSDEFIDFDTGGTVNVPVATAGSSTQTNPTNFETGDSTKGKAAVTLSHYSQSFHITSRQYQQGHRLASVMDINLRALAKKLMDVALTPVTTTNFGAAVVASATNFVSAGMPALWAALADGTSNALVLDKSLYSLLLPTTKENFTLGEDGAYGWDGGIFLNNRWTGAGAGVLGFAASPEALAIASAIPEMADPVRELIHTQESILIPDIGITVQFNMWGSLVTRNLWGSFDVAFGSAAADTSALKLVIPA